MAIETTQLTGGEAAGSGLYDELMRTMSSHLQQEFAAGRITGTDYTSAYIAATGTALQIASQFILTAEKTNKDMLLVDAQIEQMKLQVELVAAQVAKAKVDADIARYDLQTVMPAGVLKTKADTALATSQNTLTTQKITTEHRQQQKISADIQVSMSQKESVDTQTNIARYQYITPSAGILRAQYDKTQAEIAVLEQKRKTEVAQTVGEHYNTGGIIGSELKLKKSQADSFLRDAEQKAAKLYSDAFQIMYSISPDADENSFSDPTAWGINPSDALTVFNSLKNNAIA